ncbi:MAG: hypothetical protein JJE47_01120 [Acidimicrobiia bacterium]|nr:hypothetical protein [Acidimicrobiia bacterium]
MVTRRPVVAGAAIGLVWGGILRVWMRFISASPEFSWSGTGFILGVCILAGATLGFAWKRRQARGAGWWRLSILSLMLLGGAGAVMWPSVVLGGVAIGRPRPGWLRGLLGVVAIGVQIPVVQTTILEDAGMSTIEAVIAVAWYAPMLAIEAWAFSVVFAPAREGAPALGTVRKVLIATPMAAMTVFAVIATGLSGM